MTTVKTSEHNSKSKQKKRVPSNTKALLVAATAEEKEGGARENGGRLDMIKI